jgi:hypothetical protein
MAGAPPYGYPSPPPRPPLRVGRMLLGCLVAPALHAVLGGIAVLVAVVVGPGESGENQLFILLFGLPVLLLLATITTIVLGLVLIARGDNALGGGILIGWALTLLLGGGTCLALVFAAG